MTILPSTRAETADLLRAAIMFDVINFNKLWERGVILLKDDEDVFDLRSDMMGHAARLIAVWHFVQNERLFGFFQRLTTRRIIKQIERAMVESGRMIEVTRDAYDLGRKFNEEGNDLAKILSLGDGLIRISPSLDPQVIAKVSETTAMSYGRAHFHSTISSGH
tara:strand:+ start:5854 stop:6342 length:489 start_codon:yes stop_codon:yes gene_type:complete